MSNNQSQNLSLFQPTGFKVIIDRKHYSNLEFFVQSISHPGATNPAVETSYKRIQSVPQPGGQMEYGELTMDVLLDEDFTSYIEVYQWMLRLVQQPVTRGVGAEVQRTHADIYVSALTANNTADKTIKYVDAIPVAVGDIRFEAQNQSVEYVSFPVSFRFSYFDIE